MAFNPFKSKPSVDKPSRNAFDLSFANNLTMEFGKLYPVFCKECLPGDTFKIDPTFAFKFMPMYFPVQSRMRADLKFFYVRNRNLWSNWKKFIGQTDRITGQEVIPPYLQILPNQSARLNTRSLLDYLGVPTTAPQLNITTETYSFGGYSAEYGNDVLDTFKPVNGNSTAPTKITYSQDIQFKELLLPYIEYNGDTTCGLFSLIQIPLSNILDDETEFVFSVKDKLINDQQSGPTSLLKKQLIQGLRGMLFIFKADAALTEIPNISNRILAPYLKTQGVGAISVSIEYGETAIEDGIYIKSSLVGNLKIDNDGNSMSLRDLTKRFYDNSENYYIAFALPYDARQFIQDLDGDKKSGIELVYPYSVEFKTNYISDSSVPSSVNPFISPNENTEPKIMLSALPSRAYEAIFNSFYRNVEVDPFRINGQIEYDKFVPNDGDGADNYAYDFHYQYWEHDFLTDSLPSPQQGIAPLVGGRPAQTLAYDIKNDVGDNYRVYATNDGVGTLLGLAGYTNTLKEGEQYAPQSTIEALQEAITYGISINDFRNVNALQKWLEKNIRRGYRYKDQMLSHFGVTLSYEECDMPEYLGGVSEDVNVRAISSTVETENSPLGSYAGQATCQGSSKHTINKYTDEHGFIIGILCVTPIPTYSQLLPKHFTKFSPFDFFSPEFGHIGLQPIPMKEVAPLNVALEDGNQEETFGYQRAFYDYLQSTDEVHGEFRASLQDYLVDRVFAGIPRLSKEFLEVDPAQVNDVFNYTGGDDKILGQIWFDCEVVRPIPKYGVPKIAD